MPSRALPLRIAALALFVLLWPAWVEGTVRVGVYENPPLVFTAQDGTIRGLYVDILRSTAGKKGWELEFVPCPWADCLTRLDRGELDLLVAIARTEARTKRFNFTRETVLANWGQVYVSGESEIESVLDLHERRIAVVRGDVYYQALQELCQRFGVDCRFREAEDYQAALDLVSREVTEAGVVSRLYGLTHERDFNVKRSPIVFNPTSLAFAAPLNEPSGLLEALDQDLKAQKGDPGSVYHRSLNHWLEMGDGKPVIPRWVFWTLAAAGGLSGLLLTTSLVLKKRVALSTAELTARNEELKAEIEERRRAEEALRESEEKYRAVFEHSRDAIYITTPEGRAIEFNQATMDMSGYTREEIAGLDVRQVYVDSEQRRKIDAELAEDGFIKDREIRLRRKDGSEVICLDTAVAWRAEDGTILAYIGTLRDVTEQRLVEKEKALMEAQLLQSQKMEAIGTLAGGIAHDFNNILAAILGYAELALIDLPRPHPVGDKLEQVLKAGRRAKELVQQILKFSRQTRLEQSPTRLGPIINDALKLLRATLPTTIEIRSELEAQSGSVLADPSQIHQLLMNLCTNAAQAMRETGGVLKIRLENVTLDEPSEPGLAHLAPGVYQRLVVSDTGHGMDSRTMARIFEPFFTTKAKETGTGLGLALVHGIVKNHGGAITVASQPGQGTTFNVYLPLAGKAASPDRAEEIGSIPRGSERILFVDDEEVLVDLAEQMLEMLGYRVTAVTSGSRALEIFKARPDDFDLVITDQTMPQLTGAALAREILRLRPDLPVVLCTGFSDQISLDQAERLGVRRFLMKPLAVREVAEMIRDVLGEKGPPGRTLRP